MGMGSSLAPGIDLPALGVKQGHGSFLTFEFGEPKLEVMELHSPKCGLRRSAHVHGRWHLWIYCCPWRARQGSVELARSEDTPELIGRAAATLSGQKLLGVTVDAAQGRSTFAFDLGGSLETWPYGDDPMEEQWITMSEAESLIYRADGLYSCNPGDTPPDQIRWSLLR